MFIEAAENQHIDSTTLQRVQSVDGFSLRCVIDLCTELTLFNMLLSQLCQMNLSSLVMTPTKTMTATPPTSSSSVSFGAVETRSLPVLPPDDDSAYYSTDQLNTTCSILISFEGENLVGIKSNGSY